MYSETDVIREYCDKYGVEITEIKLDDTENDSEIYDFLDCLYVKENEDV